MSFRVHHARKHPFIHQSIHPSSIHPPLISAAYPESGCSGSRLIKVVQTSLFPTFFQVLLRDPETFPLQLAPLLTASLRLNPVPHPLCVCGYSEAAWFRLHVISSRLTWWTTLHHPPFSDQRLQIHLCMSPNAFTCFGDDRQQDDPSRNDMNT